MKSFNLKQIIGMAISLTALVLGGGAEVAAQITIAYPNPGKASPAPQYTCVGDTILVTADADDLTVPSGSYWGGDSYVKNEGGKITKRFFTYHPYMTQYPDPNAQISRNFEFTIRKGGSEQKVSQPIVAQSCPPKLNEPAVSIPTTDKKYNLGVISFEFTFNNETSDADIRITPVFTPDQPFKLLKRTRSNRNQWEIRYRVIQTLDATYALEVQYNEGDSIRNKVFTNPNNPPAPYNFPLKQPLGTLQPDASSYCPDNNIVFSLLLDTAWQNVLNQTINDDDSKIAACFDWSGSPAPVTFSNREHKEYNKKCTYFFSTKAPSSGAGNFQCKLTVNIHYKNAAKNPDIDTNFNHTYDVPVVQPQYSDAKGLKLHDTTICQNRDINLTTLLVDPSATVVFRDGDGKQILTPGKYSPSKSEVISAVFTAPCAWTDQLKINIIEKSKIQSSSPANGAKLLICAGESITFTATANSPITWNISYPGGGGTNESLPNIKSGEVFTRSFPANAVVTAGVDQCDNDFSMFQVQVVTPPTVNIEAEERGCPGDLVNLSGSGGNNPAYTLYDQRANKDITNEMRAYLSPTTGLTNYPLRPNDNLKLTYTAGTTGNAAGFTPASRTCSSSADARIIANAQPTVRIRYNGTEYSDGQTVCVRRDENFTLTALGADSYKWLDDPNNTQASRNLELGQDSFIRVRGENAQGCADTCTIQCVVSVDNTDRIKSAAGCPGTDLCFVVDDLPSTTYAWYDPSGDPLGITARRICHPLDMKRAGIYILRTERFGCTEALDYTLTLYPAPDINPQTNSPLCVGEDLVINYRTGLPDADTGPITFTKDGIPLVSDLRHGNGDLLIYAKSNVQPSDAGTYELTVTSDNGCSATDRTDITVEEPAVVRIILESDTVCESDQGNLKAEIETPSDNFIYKWENANRVIYDGDQSEIQVMWQRADNGPLRLTVQQSACVSTADAVIAVIPTPQLSGMPKDTNLCEGLSLCLTPVADIAPEEFRWFCIQEDNKARPLPDQTSLPYCLENADASMNGGYFVLVTHVVGGQRCYKQSDTTQLTVHPTPDIRIDGPDYVCEQSSVILRAVSNTAGTVRWSHNNSTDDVIEVSEPGLYEVTRITPYGCQNSAIHYLEQRPLPYFTLWPHDTSICRGTWTMIYGPDDMEAYFWNDGSQDKDHIAEVAGEYILTVERNGCSYRDTSRINMTFCGQFHFPTAFTPNDNRVNDTWGAISSAKDEDMAEFDLMVFDRNGKKVFHGKRISEQWDGMYKGELCPPGVYTYSFKALEKLDGIKYRTNGTVTLVR